MPDVFSSPTFQAGIGVLVLCVLIALGSRLVSIFRDYADDDQQQVGDILSNLEEMRLKGDITEAEYRTMKARAHSTILDSTPDADSPPEQEESSST